MATIKRTPTGYLVRGIVNGRDRRLTAPTKDLAEELKNHLEATRIRARHGLIQDQPRTTLGEFRADWLTRYKQGTASHRKPRPSSITEVTYRQKHLEKLDNYWLEEITRERVESLCGNLSADGRQDTAHKVCAHLKRLLSDARERGYRIDDRALAARVAKPKPAENRAFTWPQVVELSTWMPEALRRSVMFDALTGLRIGELLALKDTNVNLTEGWVKVGESKTDAGVRTVHLCAEALRLLKEQLLARAPGTSLVFPRPAGTSYDRGAYRKAMVRAVELHREWATSEEQDPILDLPVKPHNLRATAVTLYAQAGVPFEVCKEQMGWSDSAAVQIFPLYRKVAGWEAPKAVRLVDALIVGEKPALDSATPAENA